PTRDPHSFPTRRSSDLLMNEGRIEQYDTPDALLSAPRNRFVRQFVGSDRALKRLSRVRVGDVMDPVAPVDVTAEAAAAAEALHTDRKSTRLNSSHVKIS